MYLRILSHPVFMNLNFHMPMVVDLSHPLIMLEGENGSGKSTLLHSIYYALQGEEVENYAYRLDKRDLKSQRRSCSMPSSTTPATRHRCTTTSQP